MPADPEADALYGLPLDEFTKARDALARERGKEQGKEAGAAIKALRKPSLVAWGLNQLARRHPTEIEALLEAGARLRRAQMAVVEGGDADELREATRAENHEVGALAGQAASILRTAGRGLSGAHEERLGATLRAAAVDPDAGDLLRRGVLTTELSPAGFGFGIGEGEGDSTTDFRALKPDNRASTHESRKTKQEARAERERQREGEQELRAAKETAGRLEREADKAEDRARAAREAAEAATARVEALAAALKSSP